MEANIVKIGNSKGVRIPKTLLAQARLNDKVKMELKDGGILISAADEPGLDSALMSEAAFSDWNSPEEDAAWAHLQ